MLCVFYWFLEHMCCNAFVIYTRLKSDGDRMQKEINDLREAMRKDPAGFLNSSMAGMGGDVKVPFYYL